jgi:hypothetical protein
MPTQMQDTRAKIKALYIYTFATLVDWPEEMRKGDFTIGVYGDKNAVFDELNTSYSGKSIGSQKIIIKNYLSKSEVNNAHILYITEENSNNTAALSDKLMSKSSLLVTEKPGYLNQGAVINFIVDGNTQKYEINKRNAKKHNLVIASKLSSLAARVIE